ncbi:hypothetical protein C5N14_11670 [Micromonospora sp. MW-13]|nr:hypothetical protein C5N14_11670 [Micromonospora sp. MW-13]
MASVPREMVAGGADRRSSGAGLRGYPGRAGAAGAAPAPDSRPAADRGLAPSTMGASPVIRFRLARRRSPAIGPPGMWLSGGMRPVPTSRPSPHALRPNRPVSAPVRAAVGRLDIARSPHGSARRSSGSVPRETVARDPSRAGPNGGGAGMWWAWCSTWCRCAGRQGVSPPRRLSSRFPAGPRDRAVGGLARLPSGRWVSSALSPGIGRFSDTRLAVGGSAGGSAGERDVVPENTGGPDVRSQAFRLVRPPARVPVLALARSGNP